jgi:hypothetical protein
MPIHLSRREFLVRTLAAGAGAVAMARSQSAAEEPEVDPDRWALLSDTHIAEQTATAHRGEVMFENSRRVNGEIFAAPRRPCGLLNFGDCAFEKGLAGDYAAFRTTIGPFIDSGIPVHLMLGNHDDRKTFWRVLAKEADGPRPLSSKHVAVVEHRRANWFLLDSLDKTDESPGAVGDAQCDWLAKELDARASKPALVCMHHNPLFAKRDEKASGLIDTDALLAVIKPRRQVKALIHGHTHAWGISMHGDLHLINLPAVGYRSKSGAASGWVDCVLGDDEMTLTLHSRDTAQKDHLRPIAFVWREA